MFSRIQAHDFFSWEDLDYTFVPGVTQFVGFNCDDKSEMGSGKSSALNALTWGIWGKIPRPDVKIDDVIREGESHCDVTVTLTSGHQIYRSRKPNELYITEPNGNEIRGMDAKETQALITELIGMSFETFLQAVYHAQGYPNKFITANESDKAKIPSEILDLKVFDRGRDRAGKRLEVAEKQYAEVERKQVENQLEINAVNAQLVGFREMLEQRQADRAARRVVLELDRDAAECELALIKGHLERLRPSRIAQEKLEISKSRNQFEDGKDELEAGLQMWVEYRKNQLDVHNMTESLARLFTQIEVLKEEEPENALEALNAKYSNLLVDQAETQSAITNKDQQDRHRKTLDYSEKSLRKSVSKIEADIANFKNPKNKACPTCGTNLGAVDASHLAKELSNAQKSLIQTTSEWEKVAQELRDLPKNTEESLEALLKDIQTQIAATAKEQKTLGYKVANLRDLESKAEILGFNLAEKKRMNDALVLLDEKVLLSQLEYACDAIEELDFRFAELSKEEIEARGLERDIAGKELAISKIRAELEKLNAENDTFQILKIEKLVADQTSLGWAAEGYAAELSKLETMIGRLNVLREGFRELKSYVYTGFLAELTRRTNGYLAELFEVPAKIAFSNVSDDGEMSKIVAEITYDGVTRGLGLLSGGQFARADWSVRLALSALVASRGSKTMAFRIFDESMQGLSQTGMERLLKLLERLQGPTVLIEHSETFKSIISNTCNILLEDGVSRMVQSLP